MAEIDIHKAALDGDLRAVNDYLAVGGSPNLIDTYDCEPLFYAIKHDHLHVAQKLLVAGGNIRRTSRFRGDPLGVAVWNLNRRMVEFALSAGVDINRELRGETALDSVYKLRAFPPGPPGTVHPREKEAIDMYRFLVSRDAVHRRYTPSQP